MPELGDILNSINITKDKDLIDEYNITDYVPFVINRGMSFYPETILHSNFLNSNPHLDRKIQYKYYLYAIKKKKRYSKWLKNVKPSEDILTISNYYGISVNKAKDIQDMITSDDLNEMKNYLDIGGIKRSSRKGVSDE
jgi:hypothetical protein